MRRLMWFLILSLVLIVSLSAFSKKSDIRKRKPVTSLGAIEALGVRHALDAQASQSSSSPLIRWFGFYDPVTGTAVESETWTFDEGCLSVPGIIGIIQLDNTSPIPYIANYIMPYVERFYQAN